MLETLYQEALKRKKEPKEGSYTSCRRSPAVHQRPWDHATVPRSFRIFGV